MGIPIRQLYATNIDERIFLSSYIPLKDEEGYSRPPETPIGTDLWIPNTIGLKPEEGTMPVKVVRSDEETGIWLICFDDYFGNEQHLYTHKPRFKKGTKKLDFEYEDDNNDLDIGLHISSDIEMVAGDGPYAVTLIRGEYPPYPEKASLWKRIVNKLKYKNTPL